MRFLIRPAKASDLNLVRSSWLHSYRREMHDMETADYFARQHERIERLLSSSSTLIAHLDDAPDVVIGWLCSTPTLVHFAWAKRDWQRQGALTCLLRAAGHPVPPAAERITVTHLTADWRCAVRRWRYLPHLLDTAPGP